MNPRPDPLEAAIAALEAQRALLGDDVVDQAQAPLRRELEALRAQARAQPPVPDAARQSRRS